MIHKHGHSRAAQDAERVRHDGQKKQHRNVAQIRGVTSFRIGSTPSARIASICSVTTIEPSSLAIDDAFRPATMIPVSTGPSSRIMVRLTNRPVTAVAPN